MKYDITLMLDFMSHHELSPPVLNQFMCSTVKSCGLCLVSTNRCAYGIPKFTEEMMYFLEKITQS